MAALCALPALSLLAQDPAAAPAAPPAAAPAAAPAATATGTPKITCETPVHQFGSVDNREKVIHTFVVRNDGDATLEIEKVKPACGCTVPELEKKSLAPGETTDIKATLDLKGRKGNQNKAMTVFSNDPVNPEFKLTLSGISTSIFNVTPTSVNMGRFAPGQPVTKTVSINNTGEKPIIVSAVKAQSGKVTPVLRTLEEGRRWEIDVTTDGNLPPGKLSDGIQVTTDIEGQPNQRISVSGTVLDTLEISPKALTLGENPLPSDRSIYVRPGSVTEFQILDAWWPGQKYKRSVKSIGNNGYVVVFKQVPATMALNGSSIKIMTNVEGNKIYDVPVTVRAAAKPAAAKPASPTLLPGSANPAPLITPGIPNPTLNR